MSCNRRIEICTGNPEELRFDYLYKLIPNILNPGGMHVWIQTSMYFLQQSNTIILSCRKRNFYSIVNKPAWYPDDVPFKPPNHPKCLKLSLSFKSKVLCMILITAGESKMSVTEMRKVLAAFLTHCPDAYTIIGSDLERYVSLFIDQHHSILVNIVHNIIQRGTK